MNDSDAPYDFGPLAALHALGPGRGGGTLLVLSKLFRREAPRLLACLRQAAGRGDTAEVALYAGQLRSQAAALGAVRLCEACWRLEQAAGAGVMPGAVNLKRLSSAARQAMCLLAVEALRGKRLGAHRRPGSPALQAAS